ncbi:helix-turn-helix transcriptional regulator [Acinetobacter sp. B5B]|uniref:helix-turn-helix transcriptional regulator n=1 Tax=Acinetobacter baretiae TaxID=2605383 RepID=UPI0018C3502B|nr:AraC family transcriptional regulator [Acinetobacter baretiae]MBF7681909.1 helix-turn-helix transcriptional regulator [Acinetobacter baretiae]
MQKKLITLAKYVLQHHFDHVLPFSIYCVGQTQVIRNVPISKPLLIFVLSGVKEFGQHGDVQCLSGEFILLSTTKQIDMRNIPDQDDYVAVLIDFDYDDFNGLPQSVGECQPYIRGTISPMLGTSLIQLIELSLIAPLSVMVARKKELLKLIYYSGYTNICQLYKDLTVSEKVYALLSTNMSKDWTVKQIASSLFMSPSTLRRKLKNESESLYGIKHRIRLGYGLHLVQATKMRIGDIALECGYMSQSRFTAQFKQLFTMTPREIRNTKLRVESE